jgi:group I intron endonuclease
MYGKTHTELTRKKLSEVNKGNKRALGSKRSDEVIRKISERAKERVGSKNPFFGKTHSEKTRKLIAEKNKGKLPSNIQKISIDGIEYISLAEASRQLNISVPLIHYRLKKNYPNYERK